MMLLFKENKNQNEPLHLFLTRGVGTCSGIYFFQELFKEGPVCSIIPQHLR